MDVETVKILFHVIFYIIGGISWYYAFKASDGSFTKMVGLHLLFGLSFLAAIVVIPIVLWALFGREIHKAVA